MDSPLTDIRIGAISADWAKSKSLRAIYIPETESTNKLAKQDSFSESTLSENLILYTTDAQTAGRGRGNHTWQSEVGASLLSSWSFAMEEIPQPTTSCHFGLALYKACLGTWPFLPWSLKAPNDIFIGSKKVAGLLIENVLQGAEGRLIVGLGMNITVAPGSVETATSVAKALPKGAPLLGEDFAGFLDRLLFEFSEAFMKAAEPLSTTDQHSLLSALNRFPLLKAPYTAIQSDGSLQAGSVHTHWNEL